MRCRDLKFRAIKTCDKSWANLKHMIPPISVFFLGPPPSYQSLFGEIRDVRRESSNVAEFLVKLVLLLASTSMYG